jgi:hypothetical protein
MRCAIWRLFTPDRQLPDQWELTFTPGNYSPSSGSHLLLTDKPAKPRNKSPRAGMRIHRSLRLRCPSLCCARIRMFTHSIQVVRRRRAFRLRHRTLLPKGVRPPTNSSLLGFALQQNPSLQLMKCSSIALLHFRLGCTRAHISRRLLEQHHFWKLSQYVCPTRSRLLL